MGALFAKPILVPTPIDQTTIFINEASGVVVLYTDPEVSIEPGACHTFHEKPWDFAIELIQDDPILLSSHYCPKAPGIYVIQSQDIWPPYESNEVVQPEPGKFEYKLRPGNNRVMSK